MIGQGGPRPSRVRIARCARTWCRGGWVALAVWLLALATSSVAAQEQTLRLRVAWGGGAEQQWSGSVSVSTGHLSELSPLGVEADEPGSIWLERNEVRLRQRSPRTYDGFDVTVAAPLDARLVVQLTAADASAPKQIEIPLATLAEEHSSNELDQQGNRLLVRRTPGDPLRVTFDRPALVFSTGEVFRFTVTPHLIGQKGSGMRLEAQLFEARTQRAAGDAQTGDGDAGAVSFEIPMPKQEGVYDLHLTASSKGSPLRLGLSRRLAQRSIQVVVVAPQALPAPSGTELDLQRIVELDPASHPRWWERLTNLSLLPALRRGPLGNGDAHSWQHPLGQLIQLGPRGREPELSWEAYPLPINKVGVPHVLEVEYPSDVPQIMGISIIEPNAAGVVIPIGLDSGVYSPDDVAGGAPTWQRHRLIFWPRTKTPMVLITNRRDGSQAVYRQIRVLEGPARLPRAFPPEPGQPQRLLAAYYDQPLFPENFGATESLDSWSGRSLDDWVTFYQGATRLIDYCNYVGHNALMLSVLTDGSTIYPSDLLEPTPRYDTGTFFDSGQDPQRKDVLELVLRLCDREGLQMIPTLDFSSPLPQLEALRRRGGAESIGVGWVGADGRENDPDESGRATLPRYNPLNPQVQAAMLAVVREMVERYAEHPSLVGVALNLSADGYAQLPGANCGYDDDTVGRFERDTKITLAAAGEKRFAQRAALLGGEYRQQWLDWRAKSLAQFYQHVQAELAAIRPELKLYLAATGLLDSAELHDALRPALPRRMSIEEAVRSVGIYPELYRDSSDVVLLRPQRIGPTSALSAQQAIDVEFNETPDLDRHFRAAALPGSLLFHRPMPARLPSFDEKSPYRNTYTWLLSQMSPSSHLNRRRFVHALATIDAQAIFDGGALLPLGQEDALRDAVRVYRQLPAAKFETAPFETQPVTIRTLQQNGRTYLYLVNDSPWSTAVDLTLDLPPGCQLREIATSGRLGQVKGQGSASLCRVSLQPYDLVAGWFTSPAASIVDATATVDEKVPPELEMRVADLSSRAVALKGQPPLEVLSNPDFERTPARGQPVPGWSLSSQEGTEVRLDERDQHGGVHSLVLSSSGPVASLTSHAFVPPTTGRLSMLVWLKVADERRQPALRLAVQGRYEGQEYYRYAPVGQGQAVTLTTEWTEYEFGIDDLPLEGLTDLQVRFDLMGEGQVWIDDVQLHHLRFNRKEYLELSKKIFLADSYLKQGQYADCVRVLEGYWPQYLTTHVTLTEGPLASRPPHPRVSGPPNVPPQPEQEAEQSPGLWDRLKRIVPSLNPF